MDNFLILLNNLEKLVFSVEYIFYYTGHLGCFIMEKMLRIKFL